MYLPQFHRVPENDVWWGEGFTEWMAAKQAVPLFKGHEQPRIPLNGNYYDLMDKGTMEWQAALAHEYGIDGFCFYHYWFKEGRKILEKPAENLLQWKDIDMPFCFCWDPVSWARTWTKLGNSWADLYEKPHSRTTDKGILLEQDFGSYDAWKEHFYYLVPFFRDERYIKKDGKPVFLFTTSLVKDCIARMLLYWRKLAKKEGLPGLYIIIVGDSPELAADAVVLPMSYFRETTWGYDNNIKHIIPGTNIEGYSYDAVWQNYLRYMPVHVQPTLWMCVLSYDDTPRRGGETGRIYLDASPEKFRKYFALLVEKSRRLKNPFIFVDAWNEWGEGKYLEPDTTNGYKYLEAVHDVMKMTTEQLKWARERYNSIHDIEDEYDKYIELLQKKLMTEQRRRLLLSDWIHALIPQNVLAKYLVSCGYNTISIYGFGVYGRLLYDTLEQNSVVIKYAVDKCKQSIKDAPVPIYDLDDDLPQCDAMIVSPVTEYEAILSTLAGKVQCPVLSLSEVVAEAKKFKH